MCPNCKSKLLIDFDFTYSEEDNEEWDWYDVLPMTDEQFSNSWAELIEVVISQDQIVEWQKELKEVLRQQRLQTLKWISRQREKNKTTIRLRKKS
jgi:hypothetical protein